MNGCLLFFIGFIVSIYGLISGLSSGDWFFLFVGIVILFLGYNHED